MKLRSYLLFFFFTVLFLFYPGESEYTKIFAYNRELFAQINQPVKLKTDPVPYLRFQYYPQITAEGVYIADLPSFTPVFEKKEGSQENQQAINSAPKQTPEPLIKYEKREDLSYDPSLRNTPLVLNNSSVFKKDEEDQVAQNTGINPEPANTNPQQEEQNTPQEVKITDAPPNDTKISMVAEINQPAQEQIQSKQNIQSSISSQNLNVNQATPPPQNIAEPQPEKRRFGFFSELKNIDYNEK